jgi:uncharacterized protein (DUF302 family)
MKQSLSFDVALETTFEDGLQQVIDALKAEGFGVLMLPCNVTVEEVSAVRCLVRIINPEAMMEGGGLSDDPVLTEVGRVAKEKLARVAETLAGRDAPE